MHTTAFSDKIHCLKMSLTNCFLLKCTDGYLLVDTSIPGTYDSFLKQLERVSISVSEIKYLLLTHHHEDHVGFAAQLIKETGARIVVHRKAIPYLANEQPDEQPKFLNACIRLLFQMSSVFSSRAMGHVPVVVGQDDIVLDGDHPDFLKNIGIDGEILYTPGHTDDSISVVLSDGSALVGDASMNWLTLFGTRYRPIIYSRDLNEVYESWSRLIEHGAKTIYPAHGRSFSIDRLVPPPRKS
ncbi:MAG: MBL fold metallo-hydrolase [Caldiserica bacterium]|nr:MBL fold metallo-hydrolase [Caldisericota bacterium]